MAGNSGVTDEGRLNGHFPEQTEPSCIYRKQPGAVFLLGDYRPSVAVRSNENIDPEINRTHHLQLLQAQHLSMVNDGCE